MKYRIKKKIYKSLDETHVNGKRQIIVKKSEWYEASRKGRLFGFWHAIGHEGDFDGGIWRYKANTVEEMEDYIRKWHEVEYGDNYKYEIIKNIEL
jgi:hypothetical protein